MKEIKNIDKDFIQYFSEIGHAYGMNDLSMKIMAILYLEPDFVTMNDISDKTGYSLASISNTMKSLEGIGVLSKKKKAGSKKIYYYMEKNLMKINIQKIKSAKALIIGPAKEKLPKIIEKYKAVKDQETKKKLRILTEYKNQVLKFDQLMLEWINDLEKLK